MSMSSISPVAFPIVEHFYTLQGEGYYSGAAAYFIRLAGCDVGCTWCDTKESWDASKHPIYAVEQLVSIVQQAGADRVVITGGEPLMHDLTELTKAFRAAAISVNLESSGAYPMSGDWDWICISPKKFKSALAANLLVANELKIIVFNEHDLDWAKTFEKEVSAHCLLYLQPEWSKKEVNSLLIYDAIKKNPTWKLSVQVHKYIAIP